MCLASSEQVALVEFQQCAEPIRPAVIGIFFAINRCHMGWVFIQIRPPDAKLFAVHVNPFPQAFA
jgi:hypothetical protein